MTAVHDLGHFDVTPRPPEPRPRWGEYLAWRAGFVDRLTVPDPPPAPRGARTVCRVVTIAVDLYGLLYAITITAAVWDAHGWPGLVAEWAVLSVIIGAVFAMAGFIQSEAAAERADRVRRGGLTDRHDR